MLSSSLLRGKTALVTGAGRGIGLATARAFAENGASVILNSRTPGSLDDLSKELTQQCGAPCTPLYFDVSRPDAVRDGFAAMLKFAPRLDCLVNNAGILRDALIAMSTDSMLKEVFATNTFGTFYCSQFAARLMIRHRSGSIINVSSIIGVRGNEGQAVYGASKAAVIGFTKSLAKELASMSVRVNAVAPGFIDTAMISAVPVEKAQKIKDNIKMGRLGAPEDIANACVFLASDLSSYITGQVIGVDGGLMI